MEKEYDPALSVVRVFSMLSIILGHICLFWNINTYQLGGIGVQIFLFLSGYLYGNKEITDKTAWIWKRALRLFPEMYICTILMAAVCIINNGGGVLQRIAVQFLNLQGIASIFKFLNAPPRFSGLAQTWFVTVIWLCYLLLIDLPPRVTERVNKHPLLCAFLSQVLIFVFGMLNIQLSYFVQFFTGYYWRKNATLDNKTIYSVTGGLAIGLCILRVIVRKYIDGTLLYDIVIHGISWNVLAIWILLTIVGLCKIANKQVEKITETKAWKHLDKLSYSLYIAHYMFLNEPIRIDTYLHSKIAQAVAIIVLTFAVAEVLDMGGNEIRILFTNMRGNERK